MKKNIKNKKELFFCVTYILLIVSLLFLMTPQAKPLGSYISQINSSPINSNSKNNDYFNSNATLIMESIDLAKNDDYINNTYEIDINTLKTLKLYRNNIKRVDEDYLRAMTISNSTPLDFSTSNIIVEYCNLLDLPTSLVLALIDLESNFDQYEVGSSNDRGYCQVIPDTEKWLANTYGYLLELEYNPDRIFEPEYNIGLGMLYLHILNKAYGDNYHKILSEYNRGYHNLKKYYSENQTYVTSYSRGVLNREIKFKNFN